MTDTFDDLVGSTIEWISTRSTWKIIGRPYSSHFLLEKVLKNPGIGSQANYPCDAVQRGLQIGAIQLVSPSFEIET